MFVVRPFSQMTKYISTNKKKNCIYLMLNLWYNLGIHQKFCSILGMAESESKNPHKPDVDVCRF